MTSAAAAPRTAPSHPADGPPASASAGGPGAPSSTGPVAPFTELSARHLGPVRRYFIRHPVAMDVVVMVWFLVPGLLNSAMIGTLGLGGDATPDAATRAMVAVVVLPVVGTAVLFWRRRAPLLVTGAMTALGVACLAIAGTASNFDLGVALGLYAVATVRSPRTTWAAFTVAMAALGVGVWLWESTVSVDAMSVAAADDTSIGTPAMRQLAIAMVVITSLLAVAIGISVRNRRLHVADLVARANALARDREQQARLARAEERSRIAREMHDVVAHSLSVMIALADGAGAALERAPDRSRAALQELSSTGRTALGDMRRVLGVLDGDPAPMTPQPSCPDLAELVERFRTAGLRVRAEGLGTPLPPDAGLQLAVYRILSEALTNVLRHAPGTASADVVVRSTDAAVEVTVRDHGATLPAGDPGGAGRGLIGMGERAAVYGGTVEAGPWDGGWRVHAVLPWREGRTTR